ncbi:Olfactory Receptor 5V1 [Manis pentadactyla]|nr:Olfactory Receptor 5V1 [Manis pentadactyla]
MQDEDKMIGKLKEEIDLLNRDLYDIEDENEHLKQENKILVKLVGQLTSMKQTWYCLQKEKNYSQERPQWREGMDGCNLTIVTHFILMGLSDKPKVCYPLFVVFAAIYQVTLVGNRAILLAIGLERKLCTPMYYFLANPSLLDIFCPSATVPKMLDNLLTRNHSISFLGCASELYFLVALVGTEFFLLSVMAYDCFVAICFPLRYNLIMTEARCALLTAGTWAAGFLNSLLHTVSTFCLSFCKSNQINQYYCDFPLLVALSCSCP